MLEFLAANWHWALLALISGTWWLVETIQAMRDPTRLTPLQAVLLINNNEALAVDVRSEAEFRAGHIPGAIHVPLDRFPTDKQLIRNKHRALVLYCETGARSRAALRQLQKAGFERLYEIVGGLYEWRKANLPLQSEDKKR